MDRPFTILDWFLLTPEGKGEREPIQMLPEVVEQLEATSPVEVFRVPPELALLVSRSRTPPRA